MIIKFENPIVGLKSNINQIFNLSIVTYIRQYQVFSIIIYFFKHIRSRMMGLYLALVLMTLVTSNSKYFCIFLSSFQYNFRYFVHRRRVVVNMRASSVEYHRFYPGRMKPTFFDCFIGTRHSEVITKNG